MANGEMVKQMLTWNSPLSIGFDVVLGVLPALMLSVFGALGVFGAILDFFGPSDAAVRSHLTAQGYDSGEIKMSIAEIYRTSPEEGLIGFLGLITCLAMIVVTLKRSRVQPKWLYTVGLFLGVCIVAYTIFETFILNVTASKPANVLSNFYLVLVPIMIVAIKHIVMLTRGNA
jgi:hypothetical protein